jgi:hypothetical protein
MYSPIPTCPNIFILFLLYDITKPSLQDSPSLYYIPAWVALLKNYPGDLPIYLETALIYGVLTGYAGPL